MLIMLISCERLNTAARTPAMFYSTITLLIIDYWEEHECGDEPVRNPADNVPMNGVWNRELTLPIHLNISPSEAMA